MESPFSTLLFVVVGFLISVPALLVESQSADPSPSPPPPSPSPPPPSPPPPSPSSPPPPPSPPPHPPSPRSPLQRGHPPHPPQRENSRKRKSNHGPRYVPPRPPRPPPPPRKSKINAGKKIGLMFAGIAVILQIGVVGFLVFKRRQLLKVNYDS